MNLIVSLLIKVIKACAMVAYFIIVGSWRIFLAMVTILSFGLASILHIRSD